jgi:hypothetical protein
MQEVAVGVTGSPPAGLVRVLAVLAVVVLAEQTLRALTVLRTQVAAGAVAVKILAAVLVVRAL